MPLEEEEEVQQSQPPNVASIEQSQSQTSDPPTHRSRKRPAWMIDNVSGDEFSNDD